MASHLPKDDSVIHWLMTNDLVPWIGQVLNSNFASSIIGALAGAFFGALAATRFAARQETHRLKLTELRRNNAAVVLSTSIANHSLSFKKQLVKPLVDNFLADRKRYEEFLGAAAAGRATGPFELQYDYRSLTFFKHEADELRSLLVNDITADPKVIMAAMQLWQSLHSLEKVVEQRAKEMERLQSMKGSASEDEIAHAYFGLPTKAGHVDERYSDTVVAMGELLDSAIFFSTHIAEKLSGRGREIAGELGKKAEKPVTWTFRKLEDPTLLPDAKEFEDWV